MTHQLSGPVVLGINAYFHDSAAALVAGGEVIAAAAEERLTRVKHDSGLPLKAIALCLEEAGMEMSDVDHVVFYEKPVRKFERIMVTSLRAFPRGFGRFARSCAQWLGGRLWMESELCDALGIDPDVIAYSDHHRSHAASAYFCSPFVDEANVAVVTADGVGEWTSTAIYCAGSDRVGHGPHRIDALVEQRFPHSIGLLYSAITAYLGFHVNNGEYKVMGMAAYGQPRYLDAFSQFVEVDDQDGRVALNLRYFCHDRSTDRAFTDHLEELLGPARVPESELTLPAKTASDQRFADIAATLQHLCERAMLGVARHAQRLTGAKVLCLAGGVALNSVANTRIARESGFDQVYVHPAAGDAGGALGAALWFTHCVAGIPRVGPASSHGLGGSSTNEEIQSFLSDLRVRYEAFDSDQELYEAVVSRLVQGEVGGWSRGRFEWGPRALGQRSILADPRHSEMTARINQKIKFRESFRPFAPAVLHEDATSLFDIDAAVEPLTRSMLAVVGVTERGRTMLPAVTHVDGTARVQTVDRDTTPDFAALLEAFKAQTGVGCLLNTSLNLKGEPLCATPLHAYATFKRSGLDFLVMERCLVSKAA